MISLIVPSYNVKPYIEEFLESVVNQTFMNFEVLLVDDGSTDGTADIIDYYAMKYPFFRVFHKEHGGIVRAWKYGLEKAKGEYIAFADPDDILKPEMLDVQYKLITENQADVVISGILRYENEKISPMKADFGEIAEGLYEGESLEILKKNLFGTRQNREILFLFFRWNKIFKKEILLKNLSYSDENIEFGEDVCITASAILDSKKIYYSHRPLYIYRIRQNSITLTKFNIKQIENAERLVQSVLTMLKKKGRLNEFISVNYTAYHICFLIKKIVASTQPNSEKRKNLKFLSSCDLVKKMPLYQRKQYLSRKRNFAIAILKSPFRWFLIFKEKSL